MPFRTILITLGLALVAGCGNPAGTNGELDASVARPRDAQVTVLGDAGPRDAAETGDAEPTVTPDAATSPDAGTPDALTCVMPTLMPPVPIVDPPVVIVTSDALQPAFEDYARFHTVTGMPAQVVTTSQICATRTCQDADPKNDTPKAIKAWLASRPGLRYVVLGGLAASVPSRMVHDTYSDPMGGFSYDENFLTDYYYADFSEWDSNGDGKYAEPSVDAPSYAPSVVLSRVPACSAAEAAGYLRKLVQHYTAYDGARVAKALFVSNIATSFSGIDIDGAWYFEASGKTLTLLPQGFAVKKLYATSTVDASASDNLAATQIQAIGQGQNLLFHNGHGGPDDLTVEYDGSNSFDSTMVSSLTNLHYPIFLSCACDAGVFTKSGAGVRLVMNPQGGAIAYLGNTTVGLGLAGSAQLVDEVARYIKATANPWLADALKQAHTNLPKTDSFKVPIIGVSVPVMSDESWDWTEKASVLLGDAVIPVWKAARPGPPVVTATKTPACNSSELTFTIAPASQGTLRFYAGGSYYEVALTGQATVQATIAGDPQSIQVGFESSQTLYGYWDLAL